MTFNRNYAVVPAAPNYTPIPINSAASNAAVLPRQMACPLAAETVLTNAAVTTPAVPVAMIASIPSKSLVEGQPFELLISGDINMPGATPTVGFNLYSGTSMTVANDVLLKAIAAQSVPVGVSPFYIMARMVGSTASAKIQGTLRALIGGALVAEAAFTNPIANVSFLNDPVANFLVSIVPTVANAGNYVRIYEFGVNFA